MNHHQSGLKRAKDPILFLFLLLLLFIFHLVMLEGSSQSHAVDEPSESPGLAGKLLLQPLTTAPEFRVDMESAGRRRLAPFQLCLACKCCVSAADPNTCATMPCCFGIDCQLPNKPFGVCAFVPKTCNCTSCAV
ncbi:uncharacterized protein LOC116028731 [Ipomoea triloba]|uniref:uncharacterized protein LOC116028731 n=1 Tax=Ipomoea triloba TaxID=35885 RepID=UPI00125CDF67|nr:uncharacterized protein LOC116028731 [Ipomoea triloba]